MSKSLKIWDMRAANRFWTGIEEDKNPVLVAGASFSALKGGICTVYVTSEFGANLP